MYPSPYQSERPYTGQPDPAWRCPICGSDGDCPDAAPVPMPYPPFDITGDTEPGGGPLRLYTVTASQATTVMQLNDSDAARYGDAAVLIP